MRKIRHKYLEAKKELKIYKWGHEKSKRGFKILYKDLKKETARRKKAEERLKKQLAKQEQIDKMKTEFISVASHQLRTPLTAIKLFIEMLANEEVGELNEKQKIYIIDVQQSTERMIKLVNDLLNVARLETGRLKIEPSLTQFEDFIQNIIEANNVLAKANSCKITFKKPKKKLKKIPLDPKLMHQVIHNIIINAIEYSPSKSTVLVNLERKKGNIKICISNQGPAIPKDEQARIFEKFYRGPSVQKIKTEGSGLGLYISKMIVEALGGKIWFKSPIKGKKGVKFCVTIPIK